VVKEQLAQRAILKKRGAKKDVARRHNDRKEGIDGEHMPLEPRREQGRGEKFFQFCKKP